MNKEVSNKHGVPLKGDDELAIDWTKIDTPVKRLGKEIVLPGDPGEMPIDDAIVVLERVKKAESQTYDTHEIVKALPWDALVALYKAMQEIYGVVLPQSIRGWFRDVDPTFETIRVGPDKQDLIQVPVGQFLLPGMKSQVQVNYMPDGSGAYIAGSVTKKDRARLVEIVVKAREIVSTQSIYKGKAISLKVTDKGELNTSEQPEFFAVAGSEADMIHNRITADIIEASLLAPIKHSAACRRHNISLKRGILLEGRYGCGKTLTARVTAKVAIDNGWTFINLAKCQGLSAAIHAAKLLQPAVIFAEDIDRFADRSKEKVSDMVNLLDGLVPMGSSIMTVLTTNFVEKLDKALLRPGRLDAVISIDPPDAETVQRLVTHYGGESLPADVSLEQVGKVLAGEIPATVAEVVKRAKLSMVTYERDTLTEKDLVTAAESMTRHFALLAEKKAEATPAERLGLALRDVMGVDDDTTTAIRNAATILERVRAYIED